MADSSHSWWKLTFLRKKTQPKDLYEIPPEYVSNTNGSSGPPLTEHPKDPQLDARLERIVDKTTASRGRHVKVSHSGRFKEKKKIRPTLTEHPDMFLVEDTATDENQRAAK